MAIPFSFPPEDDTARLEMTLEQLLVDLFEVLRQLTPPAPVTSQQPAQENQPIIAPVDVSFNTNSLPDLVFGVKTRSPTETATATTTVAPKRQSIQSMEQLGCELRLLADRFSNKQTDLSQNVVKCGNSSASSKSNLAEKLLCMLLPKTLSYSAATIIFVGLRFLKHKFA